MSEETTIIPIADGAPLAGVEIRSRLAMIQDCMRQTMVEGVDYGKVPGCPKPSLFKPGAEKVATMFRLAPEIKTEDLGGGDCLRYRVKVRLSDSRGGFVAEGVGECSTDEEKYRWRRSVCDAEWNETREDQRREKWKRSDGGGYKEKQVRTHPADLANTVLKMAKKRAFVDAVLTGTAASSIFGQDLEDVEDYGEAKPMAQPVRKSAARPAEPQPAPTPPTPATQAPPEASAPPAPPAARSGVQLISDAQRKRLYAIYKQAGKTDEQVKAYLLAQFQLEHTADIPRSVYDIICAWAAMPSDASGNA